MARKPSSVVLVTGPESSGTRWIAGVLGQHPSFDHAPKGGHKDPLDAFWALETHELPSGMILTRRSLPAGVGNHVARYMQFEDFSALNNAADSLTVIAVVRSPWANISSWTKNRASVSGDRNRAKEQYHAAYRHIHPWIDYYLPLEAVILDGSDALSGLCRLMGFPEHRFDLHPDMEVNKKHYGVR